MIKKRIKIENLEINAIKSRVDSWVAKNFGIPFSLIQKLIRQKKLLINGKKTNANYRLQDGDLLEIKSNISEKVDIHKNNSKKKIISKNLYNQLLAQIKRNILFKDENIIVINKPYGIAVQGGSKINISIDDILDGLQFDYPTKPMLAHRIDRYTTGILLLARTKEAAQLLAKMFSDKNAIVKKYLALLAGVPKNKEGIVTSKISKEKINTKEKMTNTEDGKKSTTEYKIINKFGKTLSLVEFIPITGRTHQIRIHAAENLGTPIVGDTKYGWQKSQLSGIIETKLHLHASEIIIKQFKGKSYHLKAELPEHMKYCLT